LPKVSKIQALGFRLLDLDPEIDSMYTPRTH